jgi:Type II secretion system (T2SS), protein M
MRAWFDGLQPRERWILLAGAGVVLVLVVWVAALRPLWTQTATLRTAVDMKQRLLVDLARLEGTQAPTSPGDVQGRDQTLVVIANSPQWTERHRRYIPRRLVRRAGGVAHGVAQLVCRGRRVGVLH